MSHWDSMGSIFYVCPRTLNVLKMMNRLGFVKLIAARQYEADGTVMIWLEAKVALS